MQLLSLSKHQSELLETATEREGKLSSWMEHVAKELLKIRGDMSEFKEELGEKIEKETSKTLFSKASHPPSSPPAGNTTTVFNVGFPENVIPMINVHGDRQGKDQTLNISGVYDLRLASGQYASMFLRSSSSRPVTPLKTSSPSQQYREAGLRFLGNLKENLYSSSCCPCLNDLLGDKSNGAAGGGGATWGGSDGVSPPYYSNASPNISRVASSQNLASSPLCCPVGGGGGGVLVKKSGASPSHQNSSGAIVTYVFPTGGGGGGRLNTHSTERSEWRRKKEVRKKEGVKKKRKKRRR
ncbi:myosin heavy chain [Cystoisospora suis]|uniref:Myosin heavy chain n=1 Tax=Cystoisospora suis TaxID=483139 RepID=A0A2C6KEJ3_9APIC|nr:myosin heavy chain [Cystoisospora suis]